MKNNGELSDLHSGALDLENNLYKFKEIIERRCSKLQDNTLYIFYKDLIRDIELWSQKIRLYHQGLDDGSRNMREYIDICEGFSKPVSKEITDIINAVNNAETKKYGKQKDKIISAEFRHINIDFEDDDGDDESKDSKIKK